eukprot:GFYU01015577.1.p1 GENE.GFYU01015577.1~~GFYU01015577.1.p1  ORF type:complete len:259 (+),score=45.31 GFYU01015577.1:312-1088(+)
MDLGVPQNPTKGVFIVDVTITCWGPSAAGASGSRVNELSSGTNECGTFTLAHKYGAGSECANLVGTVADTVNVNSTTLGPQEVKLCFSNDYTDGVDIFITRLASDDHFVRIKVEGGGFLYETELQKWQRKTIIVGSVTNIDLDNNPTVTYTANLQYDGTLGLSSSACTLLIRPEPHMHIYSEELTADWFNLLAEIGGAAGFLTGTLGWVLGAIELFRKLGGCASRSGGKSSGHRSVEVGQRYKSDSDTEHTHTEVSEY